MGIIADFLAIYKTKKLSKGKSVQLSRSQIVNIIINMTDAKRNLSSDKFNEVMKKFRHFRTYTYQVTYTLEDYLNEVINLIDFFDQIAPYDKYMSVSREEYAYLLSDLRSYYTPKYILNNLIDRVQEHGSFDGYTIGGISFQSNSSLEENISALTNVFKDLNCNDVVSFLGIVLVASKFGKQEALNRFKVYIDYLLSFPRNASETQEQLYSTVNTLCNLLTNYCLSVCFGGSVLYRETPFTDQDCNELMEYFNAKLTAEQCVFKYKKISIAK